jgi:hypothetical protein
MGMAFFHDNESARRRGFRLEEPDSHLKDDPAGAVHSALELRLNWREVGYMRKVLGDGRARVSV